MTPRHITVNGQPWCDCVGRRSTFNISYDAPDSLEQMHNAYEALARDMKSRVITVTCMHSYPSTEDAVQLLREHGINAEITEGFCPSFSQRSPGDWT